MGGGTVLTQFLALEKRSCYEVVYLYFTKSQNLLFFLFSKITQPFIIYLTKSRNLSQFSNLYEERITKPPGVALVAGPHPVKLEDEEPVASW